MLGLGLLLYSFGEWVLPGLEWTSLRLPLADKYLPLLFPLAAAVVVPGLSTMVSSYGESPPPKATQGRRGPTGA